MGQRRGTENCTPLKIIYAFHAALPTEALEPVLELELELALLAQAALAPHLALPELRAAAAHPVSPVPRAELLLPYYQYTQTSTGPIGQRPALLR